MRERESGVREGGKTNDQGSFFDKKGVRGSRKRKVNKHHPRYGSKGSNWMGDLYKRKWQTNKEQKKRNNVIRYWMKKELQKNKQTEILIIGREQRLVEIFLASNKLFGQKSYNNFGWYYTMAVLGVRCTTNFTL